MGRRPKAEREFFPGRRRNQLAALAAVLSLLACTSLLGIDGDYQDAPSQDGGTTGGSSGSGGGSSGSGAASGSSAAAGTAGSGGSAGSSGGAAGATGGEACLNGTDDDGDQLIDCADPDCSGAGYQCVAPPPTGWTGPYAYWVGSLPHAACPTGYPTKAFTGWDDLKASAATCNCGCAKPANVRCEGQLGYWASSAPSSCDATATGGWHPNSCFSAFSTGWFKLYGYRSAGTCSAPSVTKDIPAAVWDTGKQLCEAQTQGAGCSGSELCAPPPPAPYSAKVCIARSGTHTCPSPYLTAHTLYLAVNDTRDCSCSCGLQAGNCTANARLAVGSNCVSSTTLNIGDCKQLTASPVYLKFLSENILTQPSCSLSKSSSGSAQPAQPVTVCCLE